MNRAFRDDDLARLRLTADPRLAPSAPGGHRLAYVLAGLDPRADQATEEVVVSDLETGQQWRPRPAGRRSVRPRWSPGGEQLALLSEAGGAMQLWLWRPGDEPARQLTRGEDEVVDLDWSPDGSTIAVARSVSRPLGDGAAIVMPAGAARRDGRPGLAVRSLRVEVVSTDGEVLWEVPPGLGDAWSPRWSPAGGQLAFILLPRHGQETGAGDGSRLWIIAGGTTAPRPVSGAGPVTAFTWGPSGADVAYLGPGPRYPTDIELRLYRCPLDGSAPAELAAGWDRSIGSTVRSDDARGTEPPALLWSAATGRIYFTVADGGQGNIGWADAAGGGYGCLTGGRRACLDPSLDAAGEIIAFVSAGAGNPGDVHLASLCRQGGAGEPAWPGEPAGPRERRVTDSNPWLAGVRLATTRLVTATDGPVPVEGWLTVPDGAPDGGAPLVVSVHGGPHYPVGWRFCFEAQRLAARGYAVLAPNPRGSGGYGREFAAAIRGAWGTADLADVERLVRACVTGGDADGDRVAITGVSYGGYLAMTAIARGAGFRAAISENGISNLLAEWGAEADGGAWLAGEMGGQPWQRPDAYVAASPITAAHQISTPLLLIHAELDQNCPIAQSEQMLCALRALGREAELVRLPGEGHLVNLAGRPSRRLARAAAVNRWLARHLGPGADPGSVRPAGEAGEAAGDR